MEGTVFVRARLAGNGSPSSRRQPQEVWKWKVLSSCVLALPEIEAPHLGVSSGGVEVEGKGWKWEGFAKFAGPAA